MSRFQLLALAAIAALFLAGMIYADRIAHPAKPANVPANQRGTR